MATNTDDLARNLADDELLVRRIFNAPAALVFRVWEMPEHMARWIGPKDSVCTRVDIDFRVDGTWKAWIVHDAYGENWMGGVFREIERDRRLVFTFAWNDGSDPSFPPTLVTVTFEETDGRTVQTFHQTPFIAVEHRDSHTLGWNQCFDREQHYVETLFRGSVR